jgi:hypothetical protein
MSLAELQAKISALLQGEPLRAIVYGAAVVVWIVVGIAHALGFTQLGPTISLGDAMVDATAAAAALTEISRRFVFSPASVAAIAVTPPVAANTVTSIPVVTPLDP